MRSRPSSSELSTCVGTPRRCPMIFAMLATDQCDVAWYWGPDADALPTRTPRNPYVVLNWHCSPPWMNAFQMQLHVCHCCMKVTSVVGRQADLKETMLVRKRRDDQQHHVHHNWAYVFHHRLLCDCPSSGQRDFCFRVHWKWWGKLLHLFQRFQKLFSVADACSVKCRQKSFALFDLHLLANSRLRGHAV